MGSIHAALVQAEDLPGDWQRFDATPLGDDADLCGQPFARPQPASRASTGWAVSPDDGPIFGERIERFANNDAADVVNHPLDVPCTFSRSDGSRWRTQEEDPLALGDDGHVHLVTSLDRPDSFNYEVGILSGDVVVSAVLNTRQRDRSLLDELVEIAWSKAAEEGVVD